MTILWLCVGALIVALVVFIVWFGRRRKHARLSRLRHRIMLVGLPQTRLEPGEMKTITVAPQRLFRAVAYGRPPLVVPAAIADWFEIANLRFGVDSLLVSPDAIPAAAFSDRWGREGMREVDEIVWPTLQIGQTVQVDVRNIDAVPHTFLGYLRGVSVG